MPCTEDRHVVLESDKETKKHCRESKRCGQNTLAAQWRGRWVLALVLLYHTREGESQSMRKGSLTKGLIKNGNYWIFSL